MGSDERKAKRILTRKADAKAKPKLPEVRARVSRTTRNKKESTSSVSASIACSFKNSNLSILHYLNNTSLGVSVIPQLKHTKKTCIINQVSRFQVLKALNVFQRRVTSIAWHPVYSQIAAAGSKGGELSWYNLKLTGSKSLPGIGPGGSIVGLKFHRDDPCLIYTTSITGSVKQIDFNRQSEKTFMTSGKFEDWFSALDVCYDKKVMIVGDTAGYVELRTIDGGKLCDSKKRFHKGKVSHLEFSPSDPYIFVSASIDRNVKVWDSRMITTSPQPICVFPHQRGVNSAYFSPCNRNTLLTTDQHSEIRVYRSPCWNEELIIPHPHRQFQHLTPIKATWHPMEDIFIVGRYPDDTFLIKDDRTLDFYDGNSGTILHRISSPTRCISSLNAFNISGDAIISGTGSSLVFWKDKEVLHDYKF